ncbi:hypothetical protein BGX27_009419 [Mortierella sp. AM989]|nr:hypothetical protein BGX27_009419 [Mortierella sp. AM989]
MDPSRIAIDTFSQPDELGIPLPISATMTISPSITSDSIQTIDASTETVVMPASESTESSLLEGGLQGWLAVLGSLLIHCFVFAPTEYVFGVFVLHYQDVFPESSASAITFVGTTGSAITYIAGFLSGIMADRFGFRPTAFVGSVIMALSLVGASFSTELWHLYVTQGVLFGVGASFAYYPAIAVPSQYFTKHRGLAIGVAVSGTGLGGFGLAPLTNALIEKVDIFWTLRILGMMIFVFSRIYFSGGASMLIAEKVNLVERREKGEEQPDQENTIIGECSKASEAIDVEVGKNRKPTFFQALHVFKDPQFLSLTLAELTASIGYLIPLYFMQTYAVYIGLSAEQGALILGLSNGSAFVGRILLGIIADRVSNTKTLLFCSWATAFSVIVFWTTAKSFGTLLLMGMTFCMFIGAYVSLVPVAVAESFGTDTIASMIGLMYGVGGLAMWGGSPLAGYILDSTLPNLSYTPVIMTAGISLVLGAICITSWVYFNWRATRPIIPSLTLSFSLFLSLNNHQVLLNVISTHSTIYTMSINERLIAACKEDNLDKLEEVLADASSSIINHTDEEGNSALHHAAKFASTGCLEVLMFFDGIEVNACNTIEGDTPLHKAAAYQDAEFALDMVQILIRGGATTLIRNKADKTPIDVVPDKTHTEVIKFLEHAALSDKGIPEEKDKLASASNKK